MTTEERAAQADLVYRLIRADYERRPDVLVVRRAFWRLRAGLTAVTS